MESETTQNITVRDAMMRLLAVCDGAQSVDGQGFNKNDSPFARSLSHFSRWSVKQEHAIHRVMLKYRSQLSGYGIDYDNLVFETNNNAVAGVTSSPVEKTTRVIEPTRIFKADDRIAIKCDYTFKDEAKSIPTRFWNADRKIWTYSIRPDVLEALGKLIAKNNITDVAPDVSNLIGALKYTDTSDSIDKVKDIKLNDAPDVDVPLKATLYNHQKKAYAISTTLNSAALLMEQGTGKTFAAIAAAGKRFQQGEIKKLLVVAPTSILHVWKNEFDKFADFPYKVCVFTGTSAKRQALIRNFKTSENVLLVGIINYESVWRAGIIDEISKWHPDMVVCDESQKLKNGQAKQTKGLFKIGDITKYKLILTGTPVTQGLGDWWGQYRFLNPTIFGSSFYAFRNRYAQMGGYMNKQIMGWKNVEECANKAHSIAYRVTKKEALDLPPEVDQTVYACLEPDAKNMYLEMERKMRAEVMDENGNIKESNASIILTKLMRLQQINGGFITADDGTVQHVSNAKLNALRDLLDNFPAGKKIVIFANFRAEIEGISRVVEESGRSVEQITGDTPYSGEVNVRERINNDFQSKPDPQVLVIQIQTGGRGLTLHAADVMIFYSLNYSLENYDQARARIHRIGQTSDKVTYIHIVSHGTVDEMITDALKEKKNLADMVVDTLKHNYISARNAHDNDVMMSDAIETAKQIFGV